MPESVQVCHAELRMMEKGLLLDQMSLHCRMIRQLILIFGTTAMPATPNVLITMTTDNEAFR